MSDEQANTDLKENKELEENPYLNNPLHGVGLKTVLQELVSHYGFDILYAYLNINCFRSNPSLEASEKFLKKTDWAREKVEIFYLYEFKNLPSVSSEQFKLPARERIVPKHQQPKDPAILSIEDGERLQDKRAKNISQRNSRTGERKGSSKSYNEQRSSSHYSRDRNSGNSSSGSGLYKKQHKPQSDDFSGNTDETYPEPPKDPWGNFKGGK